MASSFVNQIPAIVHLVQKLKPSTVLDIGKGFGKYGFLIHEYAGIDNTKKLDPARSMKEQSNISIDAVEVDADLMLPHLSQFYNKVYFDNVLEIYPSLPKYDLILMIDIIEHIEKPGALEMLKQFIRQGSSVIVATPRQFFAQELYESEFERHVSHWSKNDFTAIGYVNVRYINEGAIYLLTAEPIIIRGFGNRLIDKIRRIARAIKNEL